MRVLVAGGAGFIGSHLVDRLLFRAECEEIFVIDNLWTGRKRNLAHIEDSRLIFIEGEVEIAADVGLFDEVYHLASPASPPWYMTDPMRTIRANVFGAHRLLELLKPGGLIGFTSTSEVYGDPLVSPQPESYRGSVDCTGPRSSYDESKRCVEAMLFEAARTRGTRVRVARLFNVYGPRVRAEDGRAISNFIAQALRGEPITVYGAGLQTRSWGYIDDIVDALEIFFWKQTKNYSGPLNIGNNREISVIDVAKYIQTFFPSSQIVHLAPALQDPTNRCPDLTLARDVLKGWSCKVTYEDGVARMIEWFRENENDLSKLSPDPLLDHTIR